MRLDRRKDRDPYRVSQSPNLTRIQTVIRPPIWVNLFLIVWFISWTGFTVHLYASYFGYVEPMNVEGTLLGTALGFSFFWLMAFAVIVLLNFNVMETRLSKRHLEARTGIPGLVSKTTIGKDSIENILIVKQHASSDDSGEPAKDQWELCIDGEIAKEIVALGAFALMSASPKKTRFTICTACTLAEVEWFAAVVTNWSGKPLQVNCSAEQRVVDEALLKRGTETLDEFRYEIEARGRNS